uniref:protein Jade-1-like isoform X1 n=2 Tax=Myxine glutinosa TaxID=7769 RepID=UPI00358FFECB
MFSWVSRLLALFGACWRSRGVFCKAYSSRMKRARHESSSDESGSEGAGMAWPTGSALEHPKSRGLRSTGHRGQKPAEVFRKDLISAMKVPDSQQLNTEELLLMCDPWRPEWEKGVQVPVSPEVVPQPSVRLLRECDRTPTFTRTRKYIRLSDLETPNPGYAPIGSLIACTCPYDLDDTDSHWLQATNGLLRALGVPELSEGAMERTLQALEVASAERARVAIATQEGLGIEYDEDVVCDVCRSPDCEDSNEMVFCDHCNVCVHQACYGILKVPAGSWLCRACALGIRPRCLLCPKVGGAMKSTRSGARWTHVSCALWVPEVSIGCPERMEPVTKISHVPASRWSLICSVCREKTGACIQCSVKSCIIAFHVTCAFESGLEMRAALEGSEQVKFKAFCAKHGRKKVSAGTEGARTLAHEGSQDEGAAHTSSAVEKQTAEELSNLRARKLQQLKEEFYTLVRPADVVGSLHLPDLSVDLVFNYWKLKRQAARCRPLLHLSEMAISDAGVSNAEGEADSLARRVRMFMHLRQDLERVRNLCYMVTRREKLKSSHNKLLQQIFNTRARLAERQQHHTESKRTGAGVSVFCKGRIRLPETPTQTLPPKEKELSHSGSVVPTNPSHNPTGALLVKTPGMGKGSVGWEPQSPKSSGSSKGWTIDENVGVGIRITEGTEGESNGRGDHRNGRLPRQRGRDEAKGRDGLLLTTNHIHSVDVAAPKSRRPSKAERRKGTGSEGLEAGWCNGNLPAAVVCVSSAEQLAAKAAVAAAVSKGTVRGTHGDSFVPPPLPEDTPHTQIKFRSPQGGKENREGEREGVNVGRVRRGIASQTPRPPSPPPAPSPRPSRNPPAASLSTGSTKYSLRTAITVSRVLDSLVS